MTDRIVTQLRGGITAISSKPFFLRDAVSDDLILDDGKTIFLDDLPEEIQNRTIEQTLYGNDYILFLRVFNERQTIYSRILISDFAARFGVTAPPNRP